MPADPLSMSAGTPLPDRYHFLLPAWGEKYIRVFLDYTLPSHVAEGNIGALPAADTLLRIYTRTQDIGVFRSSPLFRQYEKDHAVSFESIDDLHLVKENPYQTLTACHERALADAAGTDTAFFFINPDAVYGDGTYAAVLRLFGQGKRAILTHGLRASLPAFAADLDALRPAPGAWPSLPPRRLARLVLDNLHPLSKAHVVAGDGNRSLGSYYWPVGSDGLVCRCFHTHPLAVRPLHSVTRLWTTLDHEYVRMACPDPVTVHLVTDSDELIAVELSVPDHLAEWVKTENVPTEDILTWMKDWTNGYHREAMRRTVVFHAGPITDEYAVTRTEAERYTVGLLTEFARRNPAAGPDMTIVSNAITSEAYAAAVARNAAEAARAAEEGARAAVARSGPGADAAASARLAVTPPPPISPPPPPSFLAKLRGKFHRQLNRSLYDRVDQLAQAARTLSEQRHIDDDRVRRLESGSAQLAHQFERERAAQSAELSRLAEAMQRQAAEADRRTTAVERQQAVSQQQAEHARQQADLFWQQAELLRQQAEQMRQQLEQLTHNQASHLQAAQDNHNHLAVGQQQLAGTLAGVRQYHERLLSLLSRSGLVSFSDRDPRRPTSQPPLGYSDYDMASLVYRPAFERAIRYLQGNDLPGCVAEFGTYRGFTAQTFAELLRDTQWPARLYLYDSFAGLPAPTGNDATSYEVVRRRSWLEGEMTPEPDIVARIRESVSEAIGTERLAIHPGYFSASLPAHPPREPVAVLHIDADFYESCRFVLQYLADANLLTDGGVLLMDDFNSNAANPNMGERKALADFQAANPRWAATAWFTYGWHGHAFFLHDTTVGR